MIFEKDGLTLAYQRFGHGPQVCIAFHGYGQQSQVFKGLEDESLTIYSIDLPFHGESFGKLLDEQVTRGLQANHMRQWLMAFVSSKGTSDYCLIGYSIGARVVLSLCEESLKGLNTIHLIAPDGFSRSFAHILSTGTVLGRTIFSQLPRYFSFVHFITRVAKNFGMIDSRMFNLVLDHTADRFRSVQLYKTWTILRNFNPHINPMMDRLALESIQVFVHLGKKDQIIPKHNVLRYRSICEGKAKVSLYPLGHRLLVDEVFNTIRKEVNSG